MVVEFKEMEVIEKLVIILFSIFSVSVTFYLCITLDIVQEYSDFIVGNITWSSSSKTQDLLVVPVTIFALMMAFVIAFQLFKKLRQSFGSVHTVELSQQLLLWLIPITLAFFDFIIYGNADIPSIVISFTGIIILIAVNIIHSYRCINIRPKIVSVFLLSSILLSIFPISVALVVSRISPQLLEFIDTQEYINSAYLLGFFAVFFSSLLSVCYSNKVLKYLPKLILIAQISLPFLFLVLYPSKLLVPNGEVMHYLTTVWLNAFILSLILLAFYDVYRRYQKYNKTEIHYLRLFSPIALFALFVAINLGTTVVPSISIDDYHFGESLLGWWSYQHGFVPYIDYLPAHGIISDDWNSFISSIFFDGTAGSLDQVSHISYAILGLISLIAIYWLTESLILALIAVTALCLPQMPYHWLLLTSFICVWINPKLISIPSYWLSIWLFSLPIIILAVPPQGVLLIASFGVMAAWQGYQFFLTANSRDCKKLIVLVLFIVVMVIMTPLAEMLFSAIRYVIENGTINQLSYGIPWHLSWGSHFVVVVLTELLRMSWVILPITCIIVFYSHLNHEDNRATVLLTIVSVFFFVMLLIPYSMGRIDPGSPSRMGIISVFSLAVLLPLMLWAIVPKSNRIFLLYAALFFPILIYKTPMSLSNVFSGVYPSINSPYLKQDHTTELPNIGLSFVDDYQWQRLINLNKTLNNVLTPEATYLDLTSRNAHYFYLNRLPATAVTAPYNMVSPSQQKRLISKLKLKLPRIALLEDKNINHDGGGLSLRNPYLYRFVLDNYAPKIINGFVLGFSKKATDNEKQLLININLKNLSDVNWKKGFSRSENALIVDDYAPIELFYVGMAIYFEGQDKRYITHVWTQGRVIYFDGNAFNKDKLRKFSIKYDPQFEREYENEIYSNVYENRNLYKIPIAWGKSYLSLTDKMKLKNNLDDLNFNINDLKKNFNNKIVSFDVKGKDPFIIYNISQLNISGHDIGFLKFTFTCNERSFSPEMQVFWWGDNYVEPNEKLSIKFIGYSGVMIVPMDSSPRWLMMDHIKGIRIDLNNSNACKSIQIKNVGLYQRTDLISSR